MRTASRPISRPAVRRPPPQQCVQPTQRLRLFVDQRMEESATSLHLLGDPARRLRGGAQVVEGPRSLHPLHRRVQRSRQLVDLVQGPVPVDPIHGDVQGGGEPLDTGERLAGLGEDPTRLEGLVRREVLARSERRRVDASDRELHQLVAEQALGHDPGLGVPADTVGEPLRDGQRHADLAPRLGRQADARDPPDLDAGQPDRRPLDEPAHLGELRDQLVLALEVAGLSTQQVDDREKDPEAGQDEAADPDLQRELTAVRHASYLDPRFRGARRPGSGGRPDSPIDGSRPAGPGRRSVRGRGWPSGPPPCRRTRCRG